MGLWASHGCWDAGYSAFARWRRELARAAGYKILEPHLGAADYDLPWDEFKPENYQGEWDTVPGDDPLLYLLVHSDCDGVIHPAQGIHIARRLEYLLPLLDESAAGGHITSMKDRTQAFIDGLRKAAGAGEDVEFG